MTENNFKPVPFPTGDKQYLNKYKLHKEGKDYHLYDTGKAGEIAFGVKLWRNPDTNKKSMPCFSYCANKGDYEKYKAILNKLNKFFTVGYDETSDTPELNNEMDEAKIE